MYFEIEKEAVNSLKEVVKEFNQDIQEEIKLEFPPNLDLGDLASTISFDLAKKLKKSPNIIADELASNINVPDIFEKVIAVGPYVNFFIDYNKFSKIFLEGIDEKYGQLQKVNEKIILEHTSANPNGPLHIGHIRNSIIGDSLMRLLKIGGRDVETQYYVNDMGRQIAMIVLGLTSLGLKIEDHDEDKIDHKIGQVYFKVNEKVN
ncbi:MAG: arginine--tRNA ligase, partial [Methanobrevibacter sp.]|nr:arginine--tRNA ligase [Methanobrevibacter sp.]